MLSKVSLKTAQERAPNNTKPSLVLRRLSPLTWNSVASLNLVFVLLPWIRDIWSDYVSWTKHSETIEYPIYSHGTYFVFMILPVILVFLRIRWAAWVVNVRLMLTVGMCLLNLMNVPVFDLDNKFWFVLANGVVLLILTSVFLAQDRIRRENEAPE